MYTVSRDRLGAGATSDVFRGTRKSDHLPVAVKVLDKLTKDPQRLENLLEDIEGARTEADLMSEVRRPGCRRSVFREPAPFFAAALDQAAQDLPGRHP